MTSVSVSDVKVISLILQALTQRLVVFDDAVMYYRNLCCLTGKMRVSVAFGRRAMSSPAGMGNASLATGALLVRKLA